ncbi:MAG: hypothetical protein AAF517_06340, partial [Planctomycetota bacterium]
MTDKRDELDLTDMGVTEDFSKYEEREAEEKQALLEKGRERREAIDQQRKEEEKRKADRLQEGLVRLAEKRGKNGASALISRLLRTRWLLDILSFLSESEIEALDISLRRIVGMQIASKLRRAILNRAKTRRGEEFVRSKKEEAKSEDPNRVTNYTKRLCLNKNGDPVEYQFAIDPEDIWNRIAAVRPCFPKRVGSQLFVEESYGLRFLTTKHDLFSWLLEATEGSVYWANGAGADGKTFLTRDSVLSMAMCRAPEVSAIEEHPLWPEPEDVYLLENARKPLKAPAEGPSRLDEFLRFFHPDGNPSHSLMEAFVLTLVWGGPPGGRPLFVVTGPRGSGKSTMVRLCAKLVGGCSQIEMSAQGFSESLGEQILADSNLTKRVVLLDNAEGYLRSPELAKWITADEIEGRPKFAQRRRRMNLLTYVATVVDPSLDSDLAARSVVLSLKETEYQAS